MMERTVQVVGWTLVHLLWQGSLLLALAWSGDRLLARASAARRYAWLVTCLGLFALLPVVTAASIVRAGPVLPRAVETVVTALDGNIASPFSGREPTEGAPPSRPTTEPAPGQSLAAWVPSLESALPIIVAIWLFGVVLLTGRLAGGLLVVRRLQRRAVPLDAVWAERVAHVAQWIGLRRNVRVLGSVSIDTPAVVGMVRPIVLLPVALLSGLTPGQLDALLLHEFAHLRRRDHLVVVAQMVLETFFFFHPAIWWLSARLRQEREHCCDDFVVGCTGDRVAYARTLAELETRRLTAPVLAATGGDLQARVTRLLLGTAPARPLGTAALVSGVLALLALFIVVPVPAVASDLRGDGPADTDQGLPATPTTTRMEEPPAAGIGAQEDGRVIRHPDPDASLDSRWRWAFAEARRRGHERFVIGWSIAWTERTPGTVTSSTDGSTRRPGPTLGRYLGASSDARQIGLLFTYSDPNELALAAVRLRSFDQPVVADGPVTFWLGHAPDPHSVDRLVALLRQPLDPGLRSELGAALALHEDHRAAGPALRRVATTDADPVVRAETISWMGYQLAGAPEATLAVLRDAALNDPDARVRDEAISALRGQRDNPEVLRTLLEAATRSTDADVRSEAVQTLAGLGSAEVVRALEQIAFEDRSQDVQMEAVDALAGASGSHARAALRRIAREHPSEDIRGEAGEQLARRGDD